MRAIVNAARLLWARYGDIRWFGRAVWCEIRDHRDGKLDHWHGGPYGWCGRCSNVIRWRIRYEGRP